MVPRTKPNLPFLSVPQGIVTGSPDSEIQIWLRKHVRARVYRDPKVNARYFLQISDKTESKAYNWPNLGYQYINRRFIVVLTGSARLSKRHFLALKGPFAPKRDTWSSMGVIGGNADVRKLAQLSYD